MGDVFATHVDGGLGSSRFKADRIHAKVGVCEGSAQFAVDEPKMIIDSAQAKNLLVKGPLLDSIIQHFEEFDLDLGQRPAPVICVRPVADVPGSVDAPVKSADGGGLLAVLPTTSGIPTGDRVVFLKFTKAGEHGVAEYRRSVDGGVSYEAAIITPASGQPISLAVGVSTTFIDHTTANLTFGVGDVYKFVIHTPTASNASRITAMETLRTLDQSEKPFYWVHHLGPATRAFAVSVDQVLIDMVDNLFLPIFGVLEGDLKLDGESVPVFFQRIMDEFDPYFSKRMVIVPAEGRYIPGGIRAAGGWSAVQNSEIPIGEWRNAATLLCAKSAAGPVNESAGWVERKKSLTMSEIRYWNDGTDPMTEGYRAYMDTMSAMGFTMLKQYEQLPGVYILKDNIKAPADSDFQEIPERRRADKLHRIVRLATLPFLNADSEVESGSGGLQSVQAAASAEVSKQMQRPGAAEISDHSIRLDPDGTFSQDGILYADLSMTIGQRTKEIRWRTSYVRGES